MKLPLVITACVYNRANDYARVLESYKTVRGMMAFQYVPVFESGYDPRCLELLKAATWVDAHPVFNDSRLGVDRNTFHAIDVGFQKAHRIIHAEDDILWAPDTLEFFLWALEQYRDDPTIFTIGAHCGPPAGPDQMYTVYREPSFGPWGWATWESRHADIKAAAANGDGRGWDFTMNFIARKGRDVICPRLRRTKHIGLHGVHANGEQWTQDELQRDWSGSGNNTASEPGVFHE